MSRKRNPANLSENVELLIVNQIRLQNKVKRVLNDEDSSIQDALDQLQSLEDNTSELRSGLKMLQNQDSALALSPSDEDSLDSTFDLEEILEELKQEEDFIILEDMVNLVDQSRALQKGLYLLKRNGELTEEGSKWQSWTIDQKISYIVSQSTDILIKEVHKSLMSDECGWKGSAWNPCEDGCKKLPDEFVDFLYAMLYNRNQNFLPEVQAHLYFPKVGTSFERSEMKKSDGCNHSIFSGLCFKNVKECIPPLFVLLAYYIFPSNVDMTFI